MWSWVFTLSRPFDIDILQHRPVFKCIHCILLITTYSATCRNCSIIHEILYNELISWYMIYQVLSRHHHQWFCPNKSAVMMHWLNSVSLSDAYMLWQPRMPLVQIMACCLFGAEPLSEPVLEYFQLDPWEQAVVNCKSNFKRFHLRKCIWKCRLRKWRPFSRSLNMLIIWWTFGQQRLPLEKTMLQATYYRLLQEIPLDPLHEGAISL